MTKPEAKKRSWQGMAEIIEVVDGDTVRAFVDLGFGIYTRIKIRVRGVDCPEMPTAQGLLARAFTEATFKPGDVVTIRSHRLDLHGRAEADIITATGENFADLLIRAGHAKPATDRC